MAKATVILSKEDIEELFGDDLDFKVKASEAALNGFADRYIKPIMNSPELSGALYGVLNELRDEVHKYFFTKQYGSIALNGKVVELLDKHLLEGVERAVSSAEISLKVRLGRLLEEELRAVVDHKIETLLNRKIDAYISQQVEARIIKLARGISDGN